MKHPPQDETSPRMKHPPQDKTSLRMKHPPQDETSLFSIEKYLSTKSVEISETNGLFIIPHIIFQFILKAMPSKKEILIMSCLVRFSLGFHRSTVKASNSFISKWTGLDPSVVRKGLKQLIELKQIKIKTINQRCISTEYYLPIIDDYIKRHKGQDEISFRTKRPEGQDETSCQGQDETSCKKEKNINKNINKNSLSTHVNNYLSSLKPKTRQKRESESYKILKQDYSDQSILDCLEFIDQNGDLKGREVKLKMSFLAQAIPDILERLENTKQTKACKEHIQKESTDYFISAKTAFENNIPKSEREQVLGEYIKNGLSNQKAILKWYFEYQNSNSL